MKTIEGGGLAATLTETVLVVEDEVLVRMVISAYLRECGYRVVEAANVAEAMLVLGHSDTDVSIVLSDVEMPGDHDGFDLARWIRRERPTCEVILAGTPGRAADAAGDLCEKGPALSKPYEPQVVLDRIRRLLSRRPRPEA